MRLSSDRIITTHAGSLPRPDDVAQVLYDVLEDQPIDLLDGELGGSCHGGAHRRSSCGCSALGSS